MNTPIEDQLRDYFTMVDRMQGPVDTTPRIPDTPTLSLVNDTTHDTNDSTMEVGRLSPDRNEPRNRPRIWMAVAASVAVLALVGGLIVVANDDTDDNVPADQRTVPVTVPDTTGVDGGTAPDPRPSDTEPSDAEPSDEPPTAPVEGESVWSFGLLADVDAESLRPLASLTRQDVVVPTAPAAWRAWDPNATAQGDPGDLTSSEVAVIEALPNGSTGRRIELTLTRFPVCGPTSPGCSLSDTTTTINGVAWQTFTETDGIRANVGSWWIDVHPVQFDLSGPMLEDPTILDYLEGLRAGTLDDFMQVGGACFDCIEESNVDAPGTEPVDSWLVPRDVDEDLVRPLVDLPEGAVVIPTYIPEGMVFRGPARDSDLYGFEFELTREGVDSAYISVRQWPNATVLAGGPDGVRPLETELPTDPDHPLVDIAGITWGWNDVESARMADINGSAVLVSVSPDVREAETVRFIEGLRAGSTDQFPGPVLRETVDGLEVSGTSERAAEVVAADARFELFAVQVGDQVCTQLEETMVPPTMTFAANCSLSTRLTGPGIVDFFPLDRTETRQLLIGVVDSPNATAVRITSPDGESVVVPTGPVNQAIDGRFFLARLDLDALNRIRLDRFTIEVASP